MRKLSKVQQEKRDKLVDDVRVAGEAYEQNITDFNDARQEAWEAFQAAMGAAQRAPDEEIRALEAKALASLDTYNKNQPGFDEVEKAHGALCDDLATLRDFRDELATEMREYYDDKSERWQQSDVGADYETWVDAWECADLEDPDAYTFPELDPDDETAFRRGMLDGSAVDTLGLDDLTAAP